MNHRAAFGFTIIEVIVTVAIFTAIAYGLIALVSNLFSNARGQGSLLLGSDQGRLVAFKLAGELRNATAGADGAYSIGQAGDQQLILYSNTDSVSDIEKIRYYVQDNKLYKGVTKPSGQTYNSANEIKTPILDDLGNGASPIFYYYDDTYDGTANNFLPQPVNVTQVNYVKINLLILKKAGVLNTATYVVSDGAVIRNLKTNLGE